MGLTPRQSEASGALVPGATAPEPRVRVHPARPLGPGRRIWRRLNRMDPGHLQLERALRVTLTSATSFLVLHLVAKWAGLPTTGVWLGVTAAQYLAWFISGGTRRGRLWTSVAALAAALAGVALALWLGPVLWALAATATLLTAAAFLAGAWKTWARIAVLAMPYIEVFTAYFHPPAGHSAWHAAAVLGAGTLALAIRFVLWRDDRAPVRADLVSAHLDGLASLPRHARRCGDAWRAVWRLRRMTLPIETDLSQGDPEDRRCARRLIQLRVQLTDRVLADRDGLAADADRIARLSDRVAARRAGPRSPSRWASKRVERASAKAASTRSEALPQAARRAAQVGAALVVALPLGMWLSPHRWAWSYLAAMLVFYNTSTVEDVLAKGWRRMGGTLAGGAAGVALADLLHGNLVIRIASILVLQVVAVLLIPTHYAGAMTALTATLVLFFSAAGQSVPSIVALRLDETLAGAVAGLLAARLVFPRHADREACGAMAKLLSELCAFLRDGAPLDQAATALGKTLEPLRTTTEPLRSLHLTRTSKADADAAGWFFWAERALQQAERARVTGRIDPEARALAASRADMLGQTLAHSPPSPAEMRHALASIDQALVPQDSARR